MKYEHVAAINELINAGHLINYTKDKNDYLEMILILSKNGDLYILKCIDEYYGVTEFSYPHFIGFLRTTSYNKLPNHDLNKYFNYCAKRMRPCVIVIGSSRSFNLISIRQMDALDYDLLPPYFMEEIFE